MTRKLTTLLTGLMMSAAMIGCGTGTEEPAPPAEPAEPAPPEPRVAVAQLAPLGDSGVEGEVTFTQSGDAVEIVAEVSGLEPGEHGFHIHEIGDCSAPDGTSAGGHFAPKGQPHGPYAADQPHHAGDFGNILANEDKTASLSTTTSQITLREGDTNVVGRAVIVHGGADDLESQPSGAAGPRVACGVIELEGGQTDPASSAGH